MTAHTLGSATALGTLIPHYTAPHHCSHYVWAVVRGTRWTWLNKQRCADLVERITAKVFVFTTSHCSHQLHCAVNIPLLMYIQITRTARFITEEAPAFSVRQVPLSGLPQHNHPMAVHTQEQGYSWSGRQVYLHTS